VDVEALAGELDTRGFVHVPQLFTGAEVERLRSVHDRLLQAPFAAAPLRLGEHAGAGSLLVEPDLFWFFDDERIAGLAGALAGGETAYLFAYALVQGRTHPWHADGDHPGVPGLKFSLFLDPVGAGDGCLTFLPGSHRPDAAAALHAAFERGDIARDDPELPGAVAMPSEPGDVQIFWRPVLHSTWGRIGPRRQVHVNFLTRPPGLAESDWLAAVRESRDADPGWRAGKQVVPSWLAEAASPAHRRHLQAYLHPDVHDPLRPFPERADIEVTREWSDAG